MTASNRIDAIIEVLIAYSLQDFRPKAPVSDALDGIDAIAVGINMLAEELSGEVASRRELEAAYKTLQQTQAKLVRSEKLAAIGELASGVAHDINNPAAWVMLSLGMLDRGVAALEKLVEAPASDLHERQGELRQHVGILGSHLREAMDGMERIRDVAGQLRSYTRPSRETPVAVSLNEIITAACKLAQPLFRNGTQLTLELQDVPPVSGDRCRLSQMLTNLLVNAVQAVESSEETCGGTVRVSSRREAGNVVLRVEDSGPGIPPDLRSRVFEPFFTTKPADKGTGLGLALVADMVEWHRGAISIETSQLGGACFDVYLPVADGAVNVESAPVGVAPCPAKVGVRPRVLFVDDEATLLRSYALAFGTTYDVHVADSADAALRLLEEDPAFDVLVCDVNMPAVGGIALHGTVVRRWPHLAPRILFLSGGARLPEEQQFLRSCDGLVLEKPVRLEVLRTVLEERLANPAREPLAQSV